MCVKGAAILMFVPFIIRYVGSKYNSIGLIAASFPCQLYVTVCFGSSHDKFFLKAFILSNRNTLCIVTVVQSVVNNF